MKSVIYTCFDRMTPFVSQHILSISKYSRKHQIDFHPINLEKQPIPKFSKHHAYKEFIKSTYDIMLFLDWDVIISPDAPNIFESITGGMGAYFLPPDIFPDPDYVSHFSEFLKYINAPQIDLHAYYNSGVVVTHRDTLLMFYDNMINIGDMIHSKLQNIQAKEHLIDCVVRQEFLINYLTTINNVDVSPLDRKWNNCYQENTHNGWRSFHDDEALDSDGWFNHYNKSDIRDKYLSMTTPHE